MPLFTDNKSGTFTGKMSADTFDLVIGKTLLGGYLQAKMGARLGKPADEVLLGTPLMIQSNYANDEGVINAMKNEKGFLKGLRIDLQKAQKHNGFKYATIQVQWGTGMDGKKGGAYAGALIRVDTEINVGNLREALTKSNESQTYWRIDP
jgi:hypothetical protein